MNDARSQHLSGLAWPPTRIIYVNCLHEAVRDLIQDAERFANGLTQPGYDAADGEYHMRNAVYMVQDLINLSIDIPHDIEMLFPRLYEAVRWLDRLLSDVRMKSPGVPPPGFAEHARRLCSPDHVDSFRAILKLIPDPLDCPNGHAIFLFEWARHHLGAEPQAWNEHADIPADFNGRWVDALMYRDEDGGNVPAPWPVMCEERRRLLIEAGLLREATNEPPPASFQCSKAELLRALGKDETNTKYLGQLTDAERLVLKDAEKPVGHARYVVRFTDPEEHTRVIDAIMRNRTVR